MLRRKAEADVIGAHAVIGLTGAIMRIRLGAFVLLVLIAGSGLAVVVQVERCSRAARIRELVGRAQAEIDLQRAEEARHRPHGCP